MLELEIDGEFLDKEEEFVFDLDKLKKIPDGNYKVNVNYIKGKGIKTLCMQSIEKPELKLFLAASNI